MRKFLVPATFGLTLLLAACGGPTQTLGSIDLAGNDPTLAVGAAAKITPTLKDTSGNAMTTTVTYTSSQPDVVAVDAQGNLTVKRLSATDKPVTITATAGGKSATLNVTTYGLELAVGTANSPVDDIPGIYAVTRFRPESGTIPTSNMTITSPQGGSNTCSLSPNATSTVYTCTFISWDDKKFSSGTYTATATVGGVTYTVKSTLSSLTSKLALPTNVAVTNSGRSVTFNATAPAGAKRYRGQLYQDDTDNGTTFSATSLPMTGTVPASVTAGVYKTNIFAYTFDVLDYSQVLPENVNASYQAGPAITLP